MEIEREHVRALFDLAVGSLDFGSGYLVDEEVEQLRAVAVLLDVDPMEGTPDDYKRRYPHRFRPYEGPKVSAYDGTPAWPPGGCYFHGCRRVESDPLHQKPE